MTRLPHGVQRRCDADQFVPPSAQRCRISRGAHDITSAAGCMRRLAGLHFVTT